MANQFNAKTHAKLQNLVNQITTTIGNSLAMDFSNSPGFKIILEFNPDGQDLVVTAKQDSGPNNPFGAPDAVPGSPVVETNLTRANAFKVGAYSFP